MNNNLIYLMNNNCLPMCPHCECIRMRFCVEIIQLVVNVSIDLWHQLNMFIHSFQGRIFDT